MNLVPHARICSLPPLTTGAAWLVLFFAGLCEVGWAIGLKYSEGYTKFMPSAITIALMVLSVVLLGWSLKGRLISTQI